MSLATEFLASIRGFLKTRNGVGLRDWLRVEPPLPQEYLNLAAELKSGYRNSNSIAKLVERCLPEEDDLPEDQGTAWPGFIAFVKDYFEYWRDVNFDDLLGAHQLLMALTKWVVFLAVPSLVSFSVTMAISALARRHLTIQRTELSCFRRAYRCAPPYPSYR
jgi:hypothetical protein